MLNKRKIRRLKVFLEVLSLFEWFRLLKSIFAFTSLEKDTHLHRLVIFLVSCSDNNYEVDSKKLHGESFLKVSNNSISQQFVLYLRKETRDLIVFEQIFINREYQKVLKYLDDSNKESLSIIDCGANIGCSSVFFKSVLPKAKIFCIEPESSNFNLLRLNLQQFDLKNTKLINKAIWSEQTTLDLFKRDQSVDAYHVMTKELQDEKIGKVETMTIPQILKEHSIESIDLLKIDIEGAEKAIFDDYEGLSKYMEIVKVLAIEVHEEFISCAEVTDILRQLNFEIDFSGEYLIAVNKSWYI